MTLTVTLPDGTSVSPGFTNTITGVYVPGTYITTQPGRHVVRWVATGVNATAQDESFYVQSADTGGILSLADAKLHLGETGTAQDEEIRAFAQVATEVVESIVGPCSPQTFTDQVPASAGGTVLLLPRLPVISVTSITSIWGTTPTWTTSAVTVNSATGVVRLLAGGVFYGGPFNVAYVVGRTVIPARYRHAALEELRHLWTTQRGQTVDSPLPDFVGDEGFAAGAQFGASFSIPDRVRELLARDETVGIG